MKIESIYFLYDDESLSSIAIRYDRFRYQYEHEYRTSGTYFARVRRSLSQGRPSDP